MSSELKDAIISANSTLFDAAELIQRNGLRGALVCESDGELVGIIMDSDIRRALLKGLDTKSSVKTVMKTSPFVVSHQLGQEERIRQTIDSGLLLVPVVDDSNRPIDYLSLNRILPEYFPKTSASLINAAGGIFPPSLVLVVGGAGYIGSMLVGKLLRLGYRVRCLDLLLYDKEVLSSLSGNINFEFMRGDCRDEATLLRALSGVDAVVHLGEIVGDPACNINQDFTIETNFVSTSNLVDCCMRTQVPRLVFTSSCSVYGRNDEKVDETSELNPVSLYARCKIECERAILAAGFDLFCPTILRLATVHGRSLRQRFDLVVNLLSIKAAVERKIQIFGGQQWRPFISVKDVCSGIINVLHTPSKIVRNQIYNLGDERENYTLAGIGELMAKLQPGIEVDNFEAQGDARSYCVGFKKIQSILGYTCENNVADTVEEITEAFNLHGMYRNYMNPRYHNLLSLAEG